LEQRAGRTIREIFAADGEPLFRRLERDLLVELLQQNHLVIAAGGGAVLNAELRRRMRESGPVVWLRASIDTLQARIAADRTTAERRPNLTAGGGRAEIETLLAQREPMYRECASLVVETDGRGVNDIVEEICRGLGDEFCGGRPR
jgi:shikimate kinase